MSKFFTGRVLISVVAVAFLAVIAASCDIYLPQRSFTLAVPQADYSYTNMLSHIKPFLEQNGYNITVVNVESNVDANRLVAEGKADLTFVRNGSSHIVAELAENANRLQTILPLTRRTLLVFSRDNQQGPVSARKLFENKTIGVEVLNGESQGNLETMFERAQIQNTKFVQYDAGDFDVRVFWGSLYGKRASVLLDSGWHAVNLESDWLEFQSLSEPAYSPITLPALPGDPESVRVTTLATDAVLVGSADIGENAVYELAETFIQNKIALVRQDPMYRSITDSIDKEALLYPLHIGSESFMRRDHPTFFERHSDALALVLSFIVIVYSAVQAIRRRMAQVRKDHIDRYFLEFMDIRGKRELSVQQKEELYDELFSRAVVQMTHEKLEKDDFNIFSRLVQQEVTILKMGA